MRFLEGKKTYISLILASLAMWAPQIGLDFSETDAAQVESAINLIIAQVLVILGIGGRAAAKPKAR